MASSSFPASVSVVSHQIPAPAVSGSQSVGGSPPPVVVQPVPDSGSAPVSNPSAFVAPVSGVSSASQLDASQVGHAPSLPAPSTVQDLLAAVGLGGAVGNLVVAYSAHPSAAMQQDLSELVADSLNEIRSNPYTQQPQRLTAFLDGEHAAYTAAQSTDNPKQTRFDHLKTDTGGAGGERLREAEVAVNFENYVGGLARPMTGQYGDFIGTSGPFKGVSFDHMGMEAGPNQSSAEDFIGSAINHTNKDGVHFVLLDFEHVPIPLQQETLRAMSNQAIVDPTLASKVASKEFSQADTTTGIVIYRGKDNIEWLRPCTKQPAASDNEDLGGLFG